MHGSRSRRTGLCDAYGDRVKDFFGRFPGARWPHQERLHLYVRGNEALRAAVRRYQDQLRATGVAEQHGLGLQDPEYLHCTVQMLTVTRREVTEEQLRALVRQLVAGLQWIDPFCLSVGPPAAGQHAAELWVDPAGDAPWARLVDQVRRSVAHVLGSEALPELGANQRPHTSLGYGIGTGDSGAITSALRDVRQCLVEVPVTELELAAVTQHPSQGAFSWQTVARVPVGASDDEDLAVDPGIPEPEPPALAEAADALVRAGKASRWRPNQADVQAVLLLRAHHARIWAIDGRGCPATSVAEASLDGIDILADPGEIRSATAEVYGRALALPVSPLLRAVLELAADYEPQPAALGGWREVFGPILTGEWSH